MTLAPEQRAETTPTPSGWPIVASPIYEGTRIPSPVPTVIELWPSADWFEREAWDMMGIPIEGHPNLQRLLMDEDWEGHPLRKDYPLGGEPVRFSGAE